MLFERVFFVKSSEIISCVVELFVSNEFSFLLIVFLRSLRAFPTSFFSLFGMLLKSLKRELSTPDLLLYLDLKSSSSSCVLRFKPSTKEVISLIFFITLVLFCVYLLRSQHKLTIFMLNKDLKNYLIALAIMIGFVSCQEESPTRAIITVTTSNGAPAYDGANSCKVILSQQGQINSAGNESNVYKMDYTSSNGSVEFEFVNEAILNIDVEYTTGNDVYTAESVIKLVREELVRKTVVVN